MFYSRYLGRFQEELEQISLKHSVGNRKNRQHANREDIIRLTLLRDEELFNTCGLGKSVYSAIIIQQ
jgi:translation machinery-associated protein 16